MKSVVGVRQSALQFEALRTNTVEARAADHKFLGSLAYRDKNTFLRLYKVYVRPHLQYCSSALCMVPLHCG